MKCPKCNKEIDFVDVSSEYGSQCTGYLRGNKIIEYETVKKETGEELSEQTFIHYPECGEDISDIVGK